MNLDEAQSWLNAQTWTHAKSYAATFPHFYTTRTKCSLPDGFEAFLWCVRELGKLKTFFKKQYIYLEIDGFEYWEMGRPIPAVQVLNKAPIDDTAHYRKPEPGANDEATIKAVFLEREKALSDLLANPDPSDDDKRKMAFLLDNQRRIHGGGKNIIDHSKLRIRYE